MQTLQQRFFTALDELAAAHEHEVIVQPNYANTGTASVVPAGTFTPAVSFRYSFSNGHNVFESEQPFFATEPPAGSNPRMDIVKQVGDVDRVLGAIRAQLEQAPRPAPVAV